MAQSALRNREIQTLSLIQLTVLDDSMEPDIRRGDILWVSSGHRALKNGRLFWLRQEIDMLIRRLQRVESGKWRAVANNPSYLPLVVDESDLGKEVEVLGTVLGRLQIV